MSRRAAGVFQEYSDTFTPGSLSQFLAARHWTLHSRRDFSQTWAIDPGEGKMLNVVHIPTDERLVDFEDSFMSATSRIADFYRLTFSELAERVSAIRADLFFIRVANSSVDGTIPLHGAGDLIESIEKMIKNAAILTANPKATSTGGRRSERVRTFLEEDLRMGHTKRGSFIITIAARLQDPTTAANTAPPNEPDTEIATGYHPLAQAAEPDDTLDFSRRVMTTLSRSLDATRRHLDSDEDFLGFEEACDAGMSRGLVEAIDELSEASDGAEIDMSFSWTPALPQEEPAPQKILFTRASIEKSAGVVERFKRTAGEPEIVTVVGPVVALSRDESAASETGAGEIFIQADIGNGIRRIGLQLTGIDYEWAIYAHRNKYPFTATGKIGKKSNRWHMFDPVNVDTTFLQDRRRDWLERQGLDAPPTVTPPQD